MKPEVFRYVRIGHHSPGCLYIGFELECDARSFTDEDLIASELVYAHVRGETSRVAYNPTHRRGRASRCARWSSFRRPPDAVLSTGRLAPSAFGARRRAARQATKRFGVPADVCRHARHHARPSDRCALLPLSGDSSQTERLPSEGIDRRGCPHSRHSVPREVRAGRCRADYACRMTPMRRFRLFA